MKNHAREYDDARRGYRSRASRGPVDGRGGAEIDELHLKYGACTPGTGFDNVENALRGQWTMNCERGKLQVAVTLAPTMPPAVQFLTVKPAPSAPAGVDACVP